MRALALLVLAILGLGLPVTAQPLGDTLVIGDTWYEIQHSGAPAPTAAIDQISDIYFVWHYSDAELTQRHIMMNAVDPDGQLVFPGGVPLTFEWSGWPVCDLYQHSFLAISFNGDLNVSPDYYGAAILHNFNFSPNSTAQPIHWYPWNPWLPWSPPDVVLFPRFRIHAQNQFHFLIDTPQAMAGDPVALKYISALYDSAIYVLDFDSTWTFVDSIISPAYELAASPVSNRLAFGWTTPHDHWGYIPSLIDNDLMMLIDDDGQDLHFEDAFNLTSFLDPQFEYLPDTIMVNRDTFRVHDFSVAFDNNNYCHVVFTTRSFFEADQSSYWHSSIIWHWTDQFPNEIKVVHNAFDDWWIGVYPGGQSGWSNVDCGAWNVKAQKPTLAQDPETGYLYCAYQVYDCDTTHLSAFIGQSGWGMPSGEVYASVSTDGGLNWSVGTNITQTITQQNAFPGDCWSEVCPYLAGITNGHLHVQYVLDKDAGNSIQTEGSATLNPVVYHKVPLELIPTTPLVPQDIFLHVGWVDVKTPLPSRIPASFRLLPPHPNPFNSATAISYQLPADSYVGLKVYDTAGRIVITLVDGWRRAGGYRAIFDGSDLPSGIYLARLTAGDFQQTQKMVLLK